MFNMLQHHEPSAQNCHPIGKVGGVIKDHQHPLHNVKRHAHADSIPCPSQSAQMITVFHKM